LSLQCCTGAGVSGTPGTGIDDDLRRLDCALLADRRGVARVDASLTSGLPMILVGMATVFAALSALVGLITLTTRLLSRFQPESSARPAVVPGAPARAEGTGVERAASDADLLRVALAAFSVHRMHRGNTASSHTPSSGWARVGRMRQSAPFRR